MPRVIGALTNRLFPLRLDGRSQVRVALIVEVAAAIVAESAGCAPVERQARAIRAPGRLPRDATEFERGLLVGLCLALVSETPRPGPPPEADLLAAIMEASACGYVAGGRRLPCHDPGVPADRRQDPALCTCRAEVAALMAGPLAALARGNT
ncbi:hypothetical protein [Methylobacterium planeticum]|uniref:Uncharacterized protein n=1 Tax=Methylobacterium planeticum TaxID=2615211 RepID=A0A6N6MSU6_9HYPH|nr:hypothetical protein [Methylobacterium planeticum]KAB1073998.1 hypothetical protein F6X51_09775 [Methylobacterium planeticum]